ncbi:MAG: hypothetical protein ABI467_05045 [Kofleriaceae bacterium]
MARRRLSEGLTPTRILLIVAALEVAIDRIAVPLSRPATGVPPTWHVALDYAGLFLQYFAGTLSVAILVHRSIEAILERRGKRDGFAHVASIGAAALAAVALVMRPPETVVVALELAFAVAVIAQVAAAFARDRDLGVQLGIVAIAVPLLIHTFDVVAVRWLWPETAYDGKIVAIEHAGVMALCVAALVSPYVFAPRPFARAVTRPGPVVIAMAIAAIGAVSARLWYPQLARAAELAIGVTLDQDQADPRLAIYLLAFATLTWTLASCALAGTPARRQIGAGIALVVLGGYAFAWTHHYVLPLLGVALIVDAGRRVRDEELAGMPISADTPPVSDVTWASYIATVKAALERLIGDVHTVTTRGEGGLATTMLVGDKDGLPVRIRIERIEGSVIAFDVVVGREIDEVRGATLCLWAIAPRGLGINPSGPPAAPTFKSGDAGFDDRFRCRGNAQAFQKLFATELRARATATLDGWLAYWEREGLRYRVYPGRGAPLDHPLPLSDLALGRPVAPERLVAVIELLADIAACGVEAQAAAPSSLDDLPALPEGAS